jgi:hypothetical protein
MRRFRLPISEFPRLDFRDVRMVAVSNVIDEQFRWTLWIGQRWLLPFAIHLIFDAVKDDEIAGFAFDNF